MEIYVREYIKIAVEVLLVVLLINFILIISRVSYTVFYAKMGSETVKEEVIKYRELYIYDDKTVTGNDVVVAIQKFKGIYDIYVKDESSNSLVDVLVEDVFDSYVNVVNQSDNIFNISEVMSLLYDDLEGNFHSNLVWVDDFNVNLDIKGVTGIEFIKVQE